MAKNAGIVFGLLIAVVLVASSNAEARRWRFFNRYNFDQNAPSEQNRNSGLRASSFNPQAVGFGAIVEQLIRGCIQESTELKTWPLDLVAQTVSPDEGQRNALEQMRSVTAKAGDTLASSCPSDVPAALPARFDALEQGLGSFIEALDSVRPTVELFYNSLNDEQKARLVAMYMSNASSQKTPSQQDKSDQSLRSNRSVRESPDFPVTQQSPVCQRWADALRAWPIREIETGMVLADRQRAELYELSASMYRAAGALAASCPTETSFTPLGQIDGKRKRIEALRQAVNLVRPQLGRFADGLNDEQKTRLANVMGATQGKPGRRRSRVSDDAD
jgi:LTXXQ motif family protein